MSRPDSNPLLEDQGLPRFDAIESTHVASAIDQRLAESQQVAASIEASTQAATFDNVALRLECAEEALARTWSPVRHLHSVMDSAPLREAYEAALARITAFHTDLTQNRALFDAYRSIKASAQYAALEAPERRVVDNAIDDFQLGGVALEGEQREAFKTSANRLAELSSHFSNNVLDATQAWSRHVSDPNELAGLPPSALAQAAQAAQQAGQSGARFTLDLPSYLAVMNFAQRRSLRQEMYRAYVTRASDQGPNAGQFDNAPIMAEILALRHAQAQRLGFASYAHVSVHRKMAKTPDEVLSFLTDLAARARPVAQQELERLTQFAREEQGIETLEAWDIPFCSERLKTALFDFSQEELRAYFPLPTVIDGMFEIATRLFAVRFERDTQVATWHRDVTFYHVIANDGERIGGLYLDPFARTAKRGGAWMDVCRSRFSAGGKRTAPIAYLTCNFTPPVGEQPALITHDEVTTLFHEFGHGLHHLLTRIDIPSVAGIAGVEWDAVELPSQLLENWCFEHEALTLISGHYETGEPLPQRLLDCLRAARHFHAGLMMMRQLEFALFDFRAHLEYTSDMDLLRLLDEVRRDVSVVPTPPFNRFASSFGHIFSGGYAAGYYSYKWAEVLASDAFACFQEAGIFNADTGRRFREEVLSRGGSRDAMESFVAFRGRPPDVSALLRHTGIEPATSMGVS